jgi:spore germination cell wall hydrolase CwlJ-like protein
MARGLRWLGEQAKQALIALGVFTGRYPRHTFAATLLVVTLAPFDTAFHPLDDNPAELDCLALNIYHEARGEPVNGKLAVGHVVLNRVLDSRFPSSACAVIKQGGEAPVNGCQFSWWCDGRNDQPLDRQAWAESQKFAGKIFDRTLKDPTDGALWYHADYVAPYWRKSLVEGPTIGRHIFYRSK